MPTCNGKFDELRYNVPEYSCDIEGSVFQGLWAHQSKPNNLRDEGCDQDKDTIGNSIY